MPDFITIQMRAAALAEVAIVAYWTRDKFHISRVEPAIKALEEAIAAWRAKVEGAE